MQTIGLFFGSYNPIHIGHLIIAEALLNSTDLAEVWLMVSPQSPFKRRKNLLDEYARYHLVELATRDNPRIKASNFEFELPRPSYTVDTLTALTKADPAQTFALVMGADNLQTLHKWKKAEVLMEHYPIYVYPRPGVTPEPPAAAQVHQSEAPLLDISATQIRTLLKQGLSTRYLLPEAVREEVERAGYYRD